MRVSIRNLVFLATLMTTAFWMTIPAAPTLAQELVSHHTLRSGAAPAPLLLRESSRSDARTSGVFIDGHTKGASPSGAYAALVHSQKPEAFYPLDESTGKVAHDDSGHHRNATYGSGVSYKLKGPLASDPKVTAVGSVTGTPVTTAPDSRLPSGDGSRTLEAWVKEYAPGSGNCCSPNASVVSYGNLDAGHGFALGLSGPFNPSIWVQGDGGKKLGQPAPITIYEAKNLWHLLDVTLSGKTVTLYLDGQVVDSGDLAVNTNTKNQRLTIGGWAGIGDVAVYASALSAQQIEGHWSVASSRTAMQCGPAPASKYGRLVRKNGASVFLQLDDHGAGRVAYDASGHCRNGAYSDSVGSVSGPLVSDPKRKGAGDDGSQPAVIAGATALPGGDSPRTVEAWVKEFPQGSGHCCSPTQAIVSYGDGAAGHGFAMGYAGPFNPSVWVQGNGRDRVMAAAPISVYEPGNRWQLVDVTLSKSAATLYLDGQAIGAGSLRVKTWVPGQGLDIGGWYGIADVAIYPRALSPAQIDAHWTDGASPAAVACASPANSAYGKLVRRDGANVYFTLDDRGRGRVAYDQSGHCRNGAYDDDAVSAPGPLPTDTGASGVHNDDNYAVATTSDAGLPPGDHPRTLEVWMRSRGDCCAAGVAMSYGDTGDGHGFSFGYLGGTSVFMYAQGDGGKQMSLATPMWVRDGPLTIDRVWHLVDVTVSGSTVTLYLDGQVIDQGHLKIETQTQGQGLTIGAGSGSALDYADASVYAKALTPRQIAAHWATAQTGSAGCGGGGSGLYDQSVESGGPDAFYTLEDYSTSRVAHDASGHCRPGAYWDTQPASGPIATEDGASQGETAQMHLVALAGGDNLPAGGSARTIEAWVKIPEYGSGSVVSYGDSLSGHEFSVSINGGAIEVAAGNTEQTFTTTAPNAIDDGLWHLLDVLYAHDVAIVVLDGAWVGAGVVKAETVVPGQGMEMGGCCIEVADIAVYSGERSMATINDDYAQSGAWTTGSCSLSAIGLYGCFRAAYHWWQDACLGVLHCKIPERPPDFVVTQASVGEAIEGTASVAVTCDGNTYLSGGAGVTAGLLPGSAIVGFGYLGDPASPKEPLASDVDDFIDGSSFSFSFGAGLGQQFITSGGIEGVVYFGGLDAGVSFDASYTVAEPNNKPPAPGSRCHEGATSTPEFHRLTDPKLPSRPAHVALVTLKSMSAKTVTVTTGARFYVSTSGLAPGSDVRLSLSSKRPLGIAGANANGDVGILLPGFRSPASWTISGSGFGPTGKTVRVHARLDVVNHKRK